MALPLNVQVRAARDAAGLSQQGLAEAIGIKSQSVIARMEDGEHEARLGTLQRIADATGATFTIEIKPARRRKA